MLRRILFFAALAAGSSGVVAQAKQTLAEVVSAQPQAIPVVAQPSVVSAAPAAHKASVAQNSIRAVRSHRTANAPSKLHRAKSAAMARRAQQAGGQVKALAMMPAGNPAVLSSPGGRTKVVAKMGQGAPVMGSGSGPGLYMATRFVGGSNEVALNHRQPEVFSATLSNEPVIPPDEAYARARLLDGEHHTALAMPLYQDASRQGHGEASLRLMEIYSIGAEGVSRNYLAAVEFKRLAMQQGITIEYPPRR